MNFFDTTIETGYAAAQKKGKDEVTRIEKLGNYPYLRDLDTIMQDAKIVNQVSIGLIDVPLRQIVGTYTKMRGNSFSKSYLPLLGQESEFARKWSNVYGIQQTEGLRDAIKAYEFMNRIYVIEGNKRISVVKYCGLFSYHATVTRLLPQRDKDDIKSLVYYASLDFYKLAGYSALWFSRPEKYAKLARLIEKNKEKIPAENPYKHVAISLYEKFRELYKSFGGRTLPITTADAFLYFLKINGFDDATHTDEYKNTVKRYIRTLASVTSDNIDDYVQIDSNVTTDSISPKRRFSNIKIGFIYPSDGQKAWGKYHMQAQEFVQKKYEKAIDVQSYQNVSHRSENYDQMQKIVEENDAVFAISPIYYKNILRASLKNNSKALFLCSSFSKFEYVETYYGRCYEQAFVLGAVGASLSSKKDFMFIAPRMLPSVLMSLNAFAQGAKMINSDAKITLVTKISTKQSDEDFNEIILEQLKASDSDICYSASYYYNAPRLFGEMGLYKKVEEKWEKMARPIWKWTEFYSTIIEDILSNRFTVINSILNKKNQRLNYWWGLDTGMLDIETTQFLTKDTQRLIKFIKNGIVSKVIYPFEGPIKDMQGTLRIKEGENARLSDIIGMDWVVEGIHTNIPYEKLRSYIDIYNGSIHD